MTEFGARAILSLLTLGVACLGAGACHNQGSALYKALRELKPGPVQLLYLEEGADDSSQIEIGNWRADPPGHTIRTIALEQIGCGPSGCPAYTVVYCADGSVRYCGRALVEPMGCHRSNLGPGDFNALASAALDIGFQDLKRTYIPRGTGRQKSFLMVVDDLGKKVILDSGGSAPARVWLLEYVLGQAIDDLDWDPVEGFDDILACEIGEEP